jgi:DNA-binding transcriptional ArsR family regulator
VSGAVKPRPHDAAELRAGKALGHPIRTEIVAYLRTHQRVSPHQLAELWELPLGTVSYHVRRLAQLGFLRLEARTSRRGAIVHHYALDADADALLRRAAERALSRPRGTRTTAEAVLDEEALDALRVDVAWLVGRLKELEAQTTARVNGGDALGLAVELVLTVARTPELPPS